MNLLLLGSLAQQSRRVSSSLRQYRWDEERDSQKRCGMVRTFRGLGVSPRRNDAQRVGSGRKDSRFRSRLPSIVPLRGNRTSSKKVACRAQDVLRKNQFPRSPEGHFSMGSGLLISLFPVAASTSLRLKIIATQRLNVVFMESYTYRGEQIAGQLRTHRSSPASEHPQQTNLAVGHGRPQILVFERRISDTAVNEGPYR